MLGEFFRNVYRNEIIVHGGQKSMWPAGYFNMDEPIGIAVMLAIGSAFRTDAGCWILDAG